MTLRSQDPRIAIIGGGIAGATAAVHLGELGLNVVLMEKTCWFSQWATDLSSACRGQSLSRNFRAAVYRPIGAVN